MVALKLNIDFSDGGLIAGNCRLRFGDLTLCNFDSLPAINHLKVRDFLAVVNSLLGGRFRQLWHRPTRSRYAGPKSLLFGWESQRVCS